MTSENFIFHFKNLNERNSFIPTTEIIPVLHAIDLLKLESNNKDIEIGKDLYDKLKVVIVNDGKFNIENIVIDINSGFSPSSLDRLFNYLYIIIKDIDKYPNSIIILGYPNSILNLQSISKILLPFCMESKITLLAINKGNEREILEKGNLDEDSYFPILPSLKVPSLNVKTKTEAFDIDFIKKVFQNNTRFLYSHFHIKFGNVDFHSNGVLSIQKCLEVENFIINFKNYIKSFFDNEKLIILPICINECGIEELIQYILNDDIELFYGNQNEFKEDINLLILTDFLSSSYKIDTLIKHLKSKNSIKKIKVLGISKFRNYSSTSYDWLIESDFSEFKEHACSYCNHDSVALTGSNFNYFRTSILAFDTYSFWEFIKFSPVYYSIEHYPSTRTLNHFDFRIICEGLFEKYSYTIANRLVNLAKSKGIFPVWIHKMLYTTDKELAPLINDFLEVLKIKHEYKIEIDRTFIKTISPDNPGEDVENLFLRIKSDLDSDSKEWESKNNVCIIDQAAHNFKTLSALGAVCKKYNLTAIAIALFLNRADTTSTKMFINDFNLHILSLYDWPVKPAKFNVCFCQKYT